MKHHSEADIDQLLAGLRRNAMDDLIARKLKTLRSKMPSLIAAKRSKGKSNAIKHSGDPSPDDGMVRFVRSFLRAERIKLTQDEFRRVVKYFQQEINTPFVEGETWRELDWRNALKGEL